MLLSKIKANVVSFLDKILILLYASSAQFFEYGFIGDGWPRNLVGQKNRVLIGVWNRVGLFSWGLLVDVGVYLLGGVFFFFFFFCWVWLDFIRIQKMFDFCGRLLSSSRQISIIFLFIN